MKEMHIEPTVLKGMAIVIVVVGEAGEDVEEPGLHHFQCICVFTVVLCCIIVSIKLLFYNITMYI